MIQIGCAVRRRREQTDLELEGNDLSQDGTKLARRGRDSVSSRAVASRETFATEERWRQRNVGFYMRQAASAHGTICREGGVQLWTLGQ